MKNNKLKLILNIIMLFIIMFFSIQNLAFASEIQQIQTITLPSSSNNEAGQNAGGNENLTSENTTGSTSIILLLKENVAKWYTVFRELAIIVMLLVLIYLGIMLAISSIASDKAKYKTMLMDWLVGFIIVFFIHYYMIGIIKINEKIVEDVVPHLSLTEFVKKYNLDDKDIIKKNIEYESDTPEVEGQEEITNSDAEVKIYETLRSRAYEVKASRAFVGTILYVMMVYYAVRFCIIYFMRLVSIMILTVIAPFISLFYAIQKILTGKSATLSTWMKEYAFTVLIQSIHAFIYVVFISAVLVFIDSSLAGIVVAILILMGMLRVDKYIREFFPKTLPKESNIDGTAEPLNKENRNKIKEGVKDRKIAAKRIVGYVGGNRGAPSIGGGAGANSTANSSSGTNSYNVIPTTSGSVDMSYQNSIQDAEDDLENTVNNIQEEGDLEESRTETARNLNNKIDDTIDELKDQQKEKEELIKELKKELERAHIEFSKIDSQLAMPLISLYMLGKVNGKKYKSRNIRLKKMPDNSTLRFKRYSNSETNTAVRRSVLGKKLKTKRYIIKGEKIKAIRNKNVLISGARGRLSGSKKLIKLKDNYMYLKRTEKSGKYVFDDEDNIEERIELLNRAKKVSSAFFDGTMNRLRQAYDLQRKGEEGKASKLYRDYIHDLNTARFRIAEPMVTLALSRYFNNNNIVYASNFSKKDIKGIATELNLIFKEAGYNGVEVGDGFERNLLEQLIQEEAEMNSDAFYDEVSNNTFTIKENALVNENSLSEFSNSAFYRKHDMDSDSGESEEYKEQFMNFENVIRMNSLKFAENMNMLDNSDYLSPTELNRNNLLPRGSVYVKKDRDYSMEKYEVVPDKMEELREKVKQMNNVTKQEEEPFFTPNSGNITFNNRNEQYMQEEVKEQYTEDDNKDLERYRRIREASEERYQLLLENNDDESDIKKLRDKVLNALEGDNGIQKNIVDERNEKIVHSVEEMNDINAKAREIKLKEIFNINQEYNHLVEEADKKDGGETYA